MTVNAWLASRLELDHDVSMTDAREPHMNQTLRPEKSNRFPARLVRPPSIVLSIRAHAAAFR
jgi:hypothetical protein